MDKNCSPSINTYPIPLQSLILFPRFLPVMDFKLPVKGTNSPVTRGKSPVNIVASSFSLNDSAWHYTRQGIIWLLLKKSTVKYLKMTVNPLKTIVNWKKEVTGWVVWGIISVISSKCKRHFNYAESIPTDTLTHPFARSIFDGNGRKIDRKPQKIDRNPYENDCKIWELHNQRSPPPRLSLLIRREDQAPTSPYSGGYCLYFSVS